MYTQNGAETVQSPSPKENDTITSFVDNALVASPDSEIPTESTYSRYRLWCESNGFVPEPLVTFKRKLTAYAKIARKRPTDLPTVNPLSMILGYKFKEVN